MDVLNEDSLVSQYVHLGSIFFAIAIVVWTSVAVWLCYSGPANAPPDARAGERRGLEGERSKRELVREAVGSGLTELFIDGKPRGPLDSRSFEGFLRGGKTGEDVASAFLSHYYPDQPRQDEGQIGHGASSSTSKGRRESSALNPGRHRLNEQDHSSEGKTASGSGKLSLLMSCLKRLLLPSSSSLGGMASQYRGLSDDQLKGDILDSSTAVLNMADQARSIGNKYLKEKEFSAAAHSYEVACMLCNSLKPFPKQEMAVFHCNCALACLELGRFGDAINECHASLVLSPPKHLAVKALYRLAVSHASLNNAFEARRCLRRCLKLDPLNVYAQVFLEELGEEAPATPSATRLVQLNWASLPRKGQGGGGTANREKVRSKKGKSKAGTKEATIDRPLDRDAGMWHSVTRSGHKLFILGGCGGATGTKALGLASTFGDGGFPPEALRGADELHVLDTETLELRRLTGANSKCPIPCCCHAAVMAGSNLVACGGLASTTNVSGLAPFLVVYDTVQGKWKTPTVSGASPRQRLGMTLNAIPAKCLNASNVNNSNSNNSNSNSSHSNNSNNSHSLGPIGRGHSASDTSECVCLFGGLEPQGDLPLGRVYNDVFFLDLDSFSWRKIEVTGRTPAARFGHSTTNLPGPSNRLLVVGGRDTLCEGHTEAFTDMHILDVDQRAWTQPAYSGSPPLRAFYHTASLLNHSCLAVCPSGPTLESPEAISVYLLDLVEWCWTRPAVSGAAPLPRVGHAGATVGSRLFIFGGATGTGPTSLVDKNLHVLELSSTATDVEAEHAGAAKPLDAHHHTLQPIVNTDKVSGDSHSFGYDKAFGSFETSSNSTTTTNGKGVHSAPTSRDERVEMMMKDHLFAEADEDSEPELSFEELLAKEKAFFQTEKLSFPRPSPS